MVNMKHNKGHQQITLDVDGAKLTFRKSDQPGALVDVTLEGKTVSVRPQVLLAAVLLIAKERP